MRMIPFYVGKRTAARGRPASHGASPHAAAAGRPLFARLFAAFSLAVALLLALAAGAGAEEGRRPVRIGVLAFRGLDQTRERWQPTADLLQARLPQYRIELLPLHNTDLDAAVAAGALDFVLTQPEHYVLLRGRHGLAAIATLMPLANGRPATQFGGVIFTRAGRPDIRTLDDVRGKRIAAAQEHSLGAYRVQQWTLYKAGVELPQDAAAVYFTGQPQDRAVFEVLQEKADVGFVRTGVLEALAREGRIDLAGLQVINRQPDSVFPQLLSTDLYPEWPVCAVRGLPEQLVKAVTLAFLNIPPDSLAALTGEYYGFSPPGDYTPLEATLLRLHVHPDRLDQFDIQDVLEKYLRPIAGGLLLLLALAGLAVIRLIQANRREHAAAGERALLLGSLGEGVYGVDGKGLCRFINPAALLMLGFAENEVIGRSQHRLFHSRHPDGSAYADGDCPIHRTLQDGLPREGEEHFFRKDGSGFPVQIIVTPMRDSQRIVGAVVAFQDISQRKQDENDLRLAATAFETQEAITITDTANRIIRVNRAFTQVTGYSAEEVIGKTPALFKSGRHDRAFYHKLWQTLVTEGHWQGEIWNRRKSGEIFPEWLTITAVRDGDGKVCNYVAAFLDISQRKQAERQIQRLAFYDPLTGLPNRSLLMERLGQAIAATARHRKHSALLFIDLDNFKNLNDSLGHDMGDRLLVLVAERLQACVRESDTVARLGGDEFVVMLDGLDGTVEEAAGEAEIVGEKILAALDRTDTFNGQEHHSTPSIGITLFHGHDHTIDEILKRGDLAMYEAKAAGGNGLRFFDPAMQAAVATRVRLDADLRRALRNGEFVLNYQLQYDACGKPTGAEALVRWQHPERGLLPPGSFIPFAESNGLILPLGEWVLAEACRQLALWQADPATRHLRVAVNVSARQFRQGGFAEQVRQVLAASGAQAGGLKLEVTESLLVDDADETIAKMESIRSLGVEFSLDDFGTGYSSLSYLKRLPLEQLKIDRSFVNDMLDNPKDAAIVCTVLALGQSLGISVVAEGVETAEQSDFLAQLGCNAYQGYYFGKPAPVRELDFGAEVSV